MGKICNPLKKATLFIPLLFLVSQFMIAQKQKKLMDSTYSHLHRYYYYFKYSNDSVKAKQYAEAYLEKAKSKNDTIQIARGYTFKSEVYKDDSLYIDHLDQMIKSTSKKPTKLFPAFFHFRKGHFYSLVKINKNEALKEILLAKKYADLTKNDSISYLMQTKIGMLVAKNGNRKKAIEIYKDCFEYYKDHKEKIGKDDYFAFLYNFSTTYSDLDENDMALAYNKLAYEYSFEQEDTLLVAYSKARQGQIHHKLQNYNAAIDSIKGAIPVLVDDENFLLVSDGYSLIGNSYLKLDDYQKALLYYQKVDSLHNVIKVYYNAESQREAFKFLRQHYKNEGDIQNQLLYLNKIISWDSIKIASDDRFEETLYDNYEKDNLLERDQLIQELEENISISNTVKLTLIGTSCLLLILFMYQLQRRKMLKKRFDEFTRTQKETTSIKKAVSTDKGKFNLPEDVVQKIVEGLESFEKNNEFTNLDLSLNTLANDLDTNANYLSKVINHHMKVSFSSYINELRINHVLDLLDKNLTIRKYSVQAIGNEVGYKNSESFSKAFYKKTGLKPSFYIKELSKRNS